MKTANGVTYAYDGDGRRVYKSNGKLYWYGAGGDILAETDLSGNTLNEYIFFGGRSVAMLPAGGNPIYYVGDMLGTSRLITQNNGAVCYDADFDPFGGEHAYTNTCPQNYKFEGKERDTETGNDDFGARSYSSRFGRWLSADWSNVPVPVPYANLTNPQTLNFYSMVADDPGSFADLDGHTSTQMYQVATPGAGSAWDPTFAGSMTDDSGLTQEEHNAMAAAAAAQAAQQTQQTLSAADVTKIVRQAQASSSDPATTALNIFNGLGNNVSVAGENLRQGVKDSKVSLDGAAADLLSHASSITKIGNDVTIASAAKFDTSQSGITIHVDAKVSFQVGIEKGLPGISNIKGLHAEVGVNVGVNKMQVATSGGKKVLQVTASKGLFHYTKPIPLE